METGPSKLIKRRTAQYLVGGSFDVARENFDPGATLCICRCSLGRFVTTLTDYDFHVQDLQNIKLSEVRETQLEFNCDALLNKEVNLLQALTSKTEMSVALLLRLQRDGDKISVAVH